MPHSHSLPAQVWIGVVTLQQGSWEQLVFSSDVLASQMHCSGETDMVYNRLTPVGHIPRPIFIPQASYDELSPILSTGSKKGNVGLSHERSLSKFPRQCQIGIGQYDSETLPWNP